MDLLSAYKISGSGLTAQRTKMNVIAENLANSETTRTADGGPYKRKMVVFEEIGMDDFDQALEREKRAIKEKREACLKIDCTEVPPSECAITQKGHRPLDGSICPPEPPPRSHNGVHVAEIVQSQEDFRLVYNPAHPDADPVTGYVAMPNVDHLTEITDMLVARRSYDANVTAMTNTKSMILKALEIGK